MPASATDVPHQSSSGSASLFLRNRDDNKLNPATVFRYDAAMTYNSPPQGLEGVGRISGGYEDGGGGGGDDDSPHTLLARRQRSLRDSIHPPIALNSSPNSASFGSSSLLMNSSQKNEFRKSSGGLHNNNINATAAAAPMNPGEQRVLLKRRVCYVTIELRCGDDVLLEASRTHVPRPHVEEHEQAFAAMFAETTRTHSTTTNEGGEGEGGAGGAPPPVGEATTCQSTRCDPARYVAQSTCVSPSARCVRTAAAAAAVVVDIGYRLNLRACQAGGCASRMPRRLLQTSWVYR